MKKILLSVLTVAGSYAANAQCTPDASLFAGISGGKILPDTAHFNYTSPSFDSVYLAHAGADYDKVFHIKTLTDTTSALGGVKVKKIKFLGLTGGPTGTTVVTDVAGSDNTWTNTGTFPDLSPVYGCATIHAPGSSLVANDIYNLTLNVDLLLYLTAIDQEVWYTQLPPPNGNPAGVQFSGYKLKVGAPVGIEELNTSDVNLVVYPNPFNEIADVKYSLKSNNKVSISVTDITGKIVHSTNLDGKSGVNNYSFAKGNLQSGIYFINLTSGEKTTTKKVSIQ